MKRCILVFLLAVVLSFPLTANLVENNPVEVTQPDGTKLSLFVSGDEYYHRVHDEKGFTILKNPQTGYAVYAIPDGNSIKISDYLVGTVDPATLGIQPNLLKYDPEGGSQVSGTAKAEAKHGKSLVNRNSEQCGLLYQVF